MTINEQTKESKMTAEKASEIAKEIRNKEYEITIALLEAYRNGWSDGYKEADKIVAVYQHRESEL